MKEDVFIWLKVFPGEGSASCMFSPKNGSINYDDAVVHINDKKLELNHYGDTIKIFTNNDSAFEFSIGGEVNVKIYRSSFGLIEKKYIVPDCPAKIETEPDIEKFLTGNADRLTIRWDNTGSDKQEIFIYIKSRDSSELKMIKEDVYYKGNTMTITKDDFPLKEGGGREEANAVVIQIYGINGDDQITPFGYLSTNVYSPTYKEFSKSIPSEN